MSATAFEGFGFARLRARPVQLIEGEGGVVLKRGCTEVAVDGEHAAEVVRSIVDRARSGMTPDDLEALFTEEERPAVASLVEHLRRRGILYDDDGAAVGAAEESPLDIFYWHFGDDASSAARKLADRRFVLIGVNPLSRALDDALRAAGAEAIEVVDDPALRADGHDGVAWAAQAVEAERWRESVDLGERACIVASTDHGGELALIPWNRFALEHSVGFLPIVLRDMVGHVGPLVVPGETACFECLRTRVASNLRDQSRAELLAANAADGRDVVGFHPAMITVIAGIAAFELGRFYAGLPRWKAGMVIDVNLLDTTMTSRRVLRAPRCPACSPLIERATTAVFRSIHEFERR
jgi:bacteriocin biosynthesis cyclodehydratase domain-containing protein